VPSDQFQRTTWMAVERGHLFLHTFRITVHRSASNGTETLPLVSAGANTVSVSAATTSGLPGVQISVGLGGRGGPAHGFTTTVPSGSTHQVVVVTDPAKHVAEVTVDGVTFLSSPLADGEPIVVHSGIVQSPGLPPAISIVDETGSSPQPTLCESLIR
jgi:hypothetical protein